MGYGPGGLKSFRESLVQLLPEAENPRVTAIIPIKWQAPVCSKPEAAFPGQSGSAF